MAPERTPPVDVPPGTRQVLALVSAIQETLGGSRVGDGLLRRLPLRHFTRGWLGRAVLASQRERPDDVTVLIGIRDRTDHRLANALRSIREQTHPAERVHPLVVDYGSEPAAAARAKEMCEAFDAEYVRVDDVRVWSRSRCLNVGIRRTRTTFLLTGDADILLSPDYLASAIRTLRRSPASVICASMLDLPERADGVVRGAAAHSGPLELQRWKAWCRPRFDWDLHPSISLTWTVLHHLIGGYDEYYEVWGHEDLDLMRRLQRLGLEPRAPSGGAFYLHQWHPKYENIPEEGRDAAIRRNFDHLEASRSIVRNRDGWGRA